MNELQTSQPYLIQARAAYSCPHCNQPLKSVFRPPDNTYEWLLLVIALFLTPFLIGIFFWFAYFSRKRREQLTSYWHCESCGWKTAVQSAASVRPQQPLPRWFWIMSGAALVVLVGIFVYGTWFTPKAPPVAAESAQPTVQKAEPRKATRGQRR